MAERGYPELLDLSLTAVTRLIKRRDVSPVEVVDATLARIASLNPILCAYISVFEEQARQVARAAEMLIMAGHDQSARILLPAVVRWPLVATLSFKAMGTPCSGPRSIALILRDSSFAAGNQAASNSPAMVALPTASGKSAVCASDSAKACGCICASLKTAPLV